MFNLNFSFNNLSLLFNNSTTTTKNININDKI